MSAPNAGTPPWRIGPHRRSSSASAAATRRTPTQWEHSTFYGPGWSIVTPRRRNEKPPRLRGGGVTEFYGRRDLGGHPAMILRNHGLLTVGETPAQAFLRMYYLDKACEIQTAAAAGGAKLVLPDPETCELTARQLGGESHDSDLQDDRAYDLAWSALLRLVDRIAPDHKD
ncbi:class II aldolase/adducin family protein [Streptomyces sp. NPDC048277]|uniref:class II aldolase/adducin family protein n=1 Tax=Streptomyces sp. NPDC048277 TaxID=3155027 RepID=UPI0033CB940D